jgi:hypothetical protein
MSDEVKGIVLVGKKWRADISVGSIRYSLGYFPTQKKAEEARLEAETAFDDWYKDFKAIAKEPIESDEAEAMPIKVKTRLRTLLMSQQLYIANKYYDGRMVWN